MVLLGSNVVSIVNTFKDVTAMFPGIKIAGVVSGDIAGGQNILQQIEGTDTDLDMGLSLAQPHSPKKKNEQTFTGALIKGCTMHTLFSNAITPVVPIDPEGKNPLMTITTSIGTEIYFINDKPIDQVLLDLSERSRSFENSTPFDHQNVEQTTMASMFGQEAAGDVLHIGVFRGDSLNGSGDLHPETVLENFQFYPITKFLEINDKKFISVADPVSEINVGDRMSFFKFNSHRIPFDIQRISQKSVLSQKGTKLPQEGTGYMLYISGARQSSFAFDAKTLPESTLWRNCLSASGGSLISGGCFVNEVCYFDGSISHVTRLGSLAFWFE